MPGPWNWFRDAMDDYGDRYRPDAKQDKHEFELCGRYDFKSLDEYRTVKRNPKAWERYVRGLCGRARREGWYRRGAERLCWWTPRSEIPDRRELSSLLMDGRIEYESIKDARTFLAENKGNHERAAAAAHRRTYSPKPDGYEYKYWWQAAELLRENRLQEDRWQPGDKTGSEWVALGRLGPAQLEERLSYFAQRDAADLVKAEEDYRTTTSFHPDRSPASTAVGRAWELSPQAFLPEYDGHWHRVMRILRGPQNLGSKGVDPFLQPGHYEVEFGGMALEEKLQAAFRMALEAVRDPVIMTEGIIIDGATIEEKRIIYLAARKVGLRVTQVPDRIEPIPPALSEAADRVWAAMLGGGGTASGTAGADTYDDVTALHTPFVEAYLDEASGGISGTVRQGRFAGHRLEALNLEALAALARECASAGDEDGAELVRGLISLHEEAFGEEETKEEDSGPVRPTGGMTADEAYRVLGLEAGASESEIDKAYRRLMTLAHPDKGGSDWMAQQANAAREVLRGIRE